MTVVPKLTEPLHKQNHATCSKKKNCALPSYLPTYLCDSSYCSNSSESSDSSETSSFGIACFEPFTHAQTHRNTHKNTLFKVVVAFLKTFMEQALILIFTTNIRKEKYRPVTTTPALYVSHAQATPPPQDSEIEC